MAGIKDSIKELHDKGLGTRKIALQLEVSRQLVIKILRNDFGIKNAKRKQLANLRKFKQCFLCKDIKPTSCFYTKLSRGIKQFSAYCKPCNGIKSKEYKNTNFNKVSLKEKEYRSLNKEKINKKFNNYVKTRSLYDVNFKLRRHISQYIASGLKTKKQIKFLPYSIDELKTYLESLFEPWMNWNNWGRYTKKWNDEDQTTWRWNIDHVIPKSFFNYSSLNDDEFKSCWKLSNLRPLNAKINILNKNKRTKNQIFRIKSLIYFKLKSKI